MVPDKDGGASRSPSSRPSPPSAPARRPASAWAPLRYSPVFRALWIAQFASNVGTWMQTVGAQWLLIDGERHDEGNMAAIDRSTTQGGSRNAALRETNQTAIIVRLLRNAQVMGVRDAICGENLMGVDQRAVDGVRALSREADHRAAGR